MNAIKKIVIGLAVACAAAFTPTAAVADNVSFAVSNGKITVTVPAGLVEQATSVYLVWDAEDKGDTFADWTNKAKIGDVAAAGGAFNVTGATLGIPNGARIRVFVGVRVETSSATIYAPSESLQAPLKASLGSTPAAGGKILFY